MIDKIGFKSQYTSHSCYSYNHSLYNINTKKSIDHTKITETVEGDGSRIIKYEDISYKFDAATVSREEAIKERIMIYAEPAAVDGSIQHIILRFVSSEDPGPDRYYSGILLEKPEVEDIGTGAATVLEEAAAAPSMGVSPHEEDDVEFSPTE